MNTPTSLGLKVIHWECHPEVIKQGSPLDPDHFTKYQRVVKPGTGITNGIQLRHTVRMSTTKGLVLSCIAEEVLLSESLHLLTFCQLRELMQSAFDKFNTEFEKRSKECGVWATLAFKVKDEDVTNIQAYLHKDKNT